VRDVKRRLCFKHFSVNLSEGVFCHRLLTHRACEDFYTPLLVAILPMQSTSHAEPALPPQRSGQPKRAITEIPRGVGLVIAHWNWKSAILSIVLRVPVFAIAAARGGLEIIAVTVLIEVAVSAFNAGFLASIVQLFCNFRPLWAAALVITVVVPVVGQGLEWWIHACRGTPHRHTAVVVSSLISLISALFNWYAMRQGTLLVGAQQRSFGEDLRRLPLAIARFLSVGPRWLVRKLTAS